jgi:hypothetical protein
VVFSGYSCFLNQNNWLHVWYMYVYHSDLSRYVSDGTVGQGDNNNGLEKFTN